MVYTYDEALKATEDYFQGDDLAAKVWIDKYALRDNEGNILEKTPSDMHRRLASEFARVEKNKFKDPFTEDQIFDLFDHFKYIIPQGSVLYGCGNPYQVVSLSNCVHGESLVYTKEYGLVKMKDIRPGYHVLTHKNRFKKVLRHWSNGIKNTLTVTRTFSNKRPSVRDEQEMSRFLSITPEHKVYTQDEKWISIDNYLNKQNKKLKQPEFYYQGDVPGVFPLENGQHIEVGNDFAWICGLYLAEGSIHKQYTNHPNVYFTLNINETEYVERIRQFSQKYIGSDVYVQTWDGYNFIQVNIYNPQFATLMINIFGSGFDKKRIPEWVFGTHPNFKKSLVEGFLCGDGTNYESFEDDYNVFSLANPTLAYEIGLLSRSLKKNVRFNFLTKGKLIKHRTITTTISNSEDKISIISSPVSVEVFDMEVEDDHSFVAGDIICHNCFVVASPEDSYGGILKTDQELVQISKRRGGVGIDLSKLRPAGFPTKNSSRKSTGIISWMRRYSNSIREVGQDGRRGALMLTINCHHPDILDFINIKNDPKKITGANLSVRYTNEFLIALENNEEYELRFPVDSTNVVAKLPAKQIWDAAVKSSWNRAEPGILFWNNIISYNAIDCYSEYGYSTQSTNPCAELPLCEYDSCRLMIQNLFSYVIDPFTSKASFDWKLFSDHAKIAQRLMDDLIDLEIEKINNIILKIIKDPEQEHIKKVELDLWFYIKERCENGRRTGLGITGTGDCLAALGIKYGSEESIKYVDAIHRQQKYGSFKSSVDMAKELGPFPIWDWEKERNSKFLLEIKKDFPQLYAEMRYFGRRNIGNLTIAPTGSMSLLTQTTSGIEPLFMLEPYKRRKKINPSDKNAHVDFVDQSGDNWQEFEVIHPKLRLWMKITGETDWRLSPWFGCCAEDLDWKQRVKLQAAAQRHIDHAISSTINLPENVSLEKVDEIFRTAWKEGLKGITVYRKNCRTGVLVEKKENNKQSFVKRPKELNCDIYHVSIKGKPHTICVSLLDNKPYEILAVCEKAGRNLSIGKVIKRKKGWYDLYNIEGELIYENITGSCNSEEANITRMVSMSLRHNIPVEYIFDQLQKVSGENINGFARSISRCLKKYIPEGTLIGEKCPECNEILRFSEGCKSCICGYSKCS